jgi:hypothetical protein
LPPIPTDRDSVVAAYHTAFASVFASTGNTTQSDVAGHRSACEAYSRLHPEVSDPAILRSRVIIIIGRELLKDPGAFWHTAQHGQHT